MAKTYYKLFGQEFVGAQADMMAHVFSELLTRYALPDEARACLMTDRILILQTDGAKLELVDLSDNSLTSTIYPHLKRVSCLCASARSVTAGILLLGDDQGNVERFHVSFNQTTEQWDFVLEGEISGCEKPARNIATDAVGRLFAAASTGAIVRYAFSGAEQLRADAAYHLELKFAGARIEGVQPQEQYQILKYAGAY